MHIFIKPFKCRIGMHDWYGEAVVKDMQVGDHRRPRNDPYFVRTCDRCMKKVLFEVNLIT